MYRLENAVTELAERLARAIAQNCDMQSHQIRNLMDGAREEALNLSAAIRQTIIDEIEARK